MKKLWFILKSWIDILKILMINSFIVFILCNISYKNPENLHKEGSTVKLQSVREILPDSKVKKIFWTLNVIATYHDYGQKLGYCVRIEVYTFSAHRFSLSLLEATEKTIKNCANFGNIFPTPCTQPSKKNSFDNQMIFIDIPFWTIHISWLFFFYCKKGGLDKDDFQYRPNLGTDTCQGDSGGPLWRNVEVIKKRHKTF